MRRISVIILLIMCTLCSVTEAIAQSAEAKERISSLESQLKESSEIDQITILCEIAELYCRQKTDKALNYLNKANKLASKNNANPTLQLQILNGYGSTHYFKKNYRNSLSYYEKAAQLAHDNKESIAEAYALFNAGIVYKTQKLYPKALASLEKSLPLAKKAEDYSLIVQNYKALYECANLAKDYKKAVTYYDNYIKAVTDSKQLSSNLTVLTSSYQGETKFMVMAISDVMDTEAKLLEMDSALVEVELQKQELTQVTEQKDKEIEDLNKQTEDQDKKLKSSKAENDENQMLINKQRQVITAFIIIGVVVLGLLGVLFFMLRKIKRSNKRLETQKSEIEDQKKLIQVKNDQITDSINYARKIQDSILVPESKIKKYVPDMFIYYKPKDIVSGDFYWFSKYENKYVITAIDCTGHGVPGAFLSMIGNTLLHEIVNIKHVFKPDQILAMLHTGITLALNQDSEDTDSEDGMDMSLCTVDTKQNRFQFAGAKNSLYVVQGDKLKILKANYYSIGGKPLRPGMEVAFTCYDFMYDENTSIYMFSDGYLDQFGGEGNEKFNTQRFKDMIIENRHLPMEKQKEIFTKTMEEWKGDR
ncbi:MAG: tetratricopeptide repeat protein [Bacteroidales bacterium]|nr:tetratricopeptide repeat protein [Bacteroidales bacterium]